MRLLSDFVGKRVSETRRDARRENPLRKNPSMVEILVPGGSEVAGENDQGDRNAVHNDFLSCLGDMNFLGQTHICTRIRPGKHLSCYFPI